MAKRSKKKKRPPEPDQVKVAKTKEFFSGKSSGVFLTVIVQALVIAAAALWIYWPVLRGDWLWDDDLLVTDNAVVHDPNGLWKIWFDPGRLYDYQPLKFSVVWLQWQLLGNEPLGYHLTNLLLHIFGALLVWRLLSKFHLRLAWLGGLIFAIHPVQVESVAWIAELKNTLSLPFFLLAMCAWIDYEDLGKRRDYFLALGLFLAAMLCKPTMVMFPVVILLHAWWKRGRIGWRDSKAGAPFFVVSLALGLVTVWFLHHHVIGDVPVPLGGFFSRLACAGLSVSFYFSKCFLPVGLLPIYPKWVVDPPMLAQFLPWPVFLAVTFWFWKRRGTWGRHALLGLGFFLINLAPFVGFNAASYMAFTWVMDHILYLPMIGLIGLAVAALGRMENQLPPSFRPYGIGLATVILALLAFQSHAYAKRFVNSETLWSYDLQCDPAAYKAHLILGGVMFKKGRLAEAMAEDEQALRIKPDYAEAHSNLGFALQRSGRLSEAIAQFKQALQINPQFAEVHFNFGLVLFQSGRISEAIDQYRQALQIKPDYAEAHNDLGNALRLSGRLPEALEEYKQALRISPDNAEMHYNLGFILQQTGQISEAIEQYEQALRVNPDDASMHYALGNALAQTGRLSEAIEHYEQAVQIKPDYAEAHNNLGTALSETGRLDEAGQQLEEALRIRPDYAEARQNLARLQAIEKTLPAKN